MALMHWDPFAELFRNRSTSWTPAVDIFEDGESYVVKVELPEVDAKEVDIRLDSDTLTITGERKLERDEDKERYHTIERFYGKFSRRFHLPETVEQDKIAAEARDGVLRIVLPKKAETKPREIQVEVA